MDPLVVSSARLACSQGSAPASLSVSAAGRRSLDGQPLATVMDSAAFTNIPAFGLCRSRANPEVVEASETEQGALMPRPCRPVPLGPWAPGCPSRQQDGAPLLTLSSTCACAWAGVISVLEPGRTS